MPHFINRLLNWYLSRGALPYWCILFLDSLSVYIAGLAGCFLLYRRGDVLEYFTLVNLGLLIVIAIHIVFLVIFKTYRSVVRYTSFIDLKQIGYAMVCAAVTSQVAGMVIRSVPSLDDSIFMPGRKCLAIICVTATLVMWVMRVMVKSSFDVATHGGRHRAFIYGIKEGGVSLARSMRGDAHPTLELAGFIDSSGQMVGRLLMGVRIFPMDEGLVQTMAKYGADTLLVSPLQHANFREHKELINILIEAKIRIMMLPPMEQWDGKSELRYNRLRKIDIEDLLPRSAIDVDMDSIAELVKGKKVLITGGAGSIGSEMVRQVAGCHPASLVLVDQAETPMHAMRLEMEREHPELSGKVETIVASICAAEIMDHIFAKVRPDYVFHAAAFKHVPMMEDNPHSAIQNNVRGTRIIADLAVKYGVSKFVMVSTDKAVNPTNIMGCSKRICEIYCQALDRKLAKEHPDGPRTCFITTRFGNVLGSNGSFVPIFKEQIKRGGPVTVTHPDIVRYFMLIPEACQLVLRAGFLGEGGEIYAFDMGDPVRIADVAKLMIRLSGAENVQIKYTGLRDGEKLYEEVMADKEHTHPTSHPKILGATVREYSYEQALHYEEALYEASLQPDDMEVVRLMKEMVPEFRSRQSKYEALDPKE